MVGHARIGAPLGGGFDFSAAPVVKAPPIRFWTFGHFAQANSGTQIQDFSTERAWLLNPNQSYGVKDSSSTLWGIFQASWTGPDISGCVMQWPQEDRRTVVEIAFADPKTEGTTAHRGLYALASVPLGNGMFDFDNVRGASGPSGNVIPVALIPAPKVVGVGKEMDGFQELELELETPTTFSEAGQDKPVALIEGYRLLYVAGAEPTSSDPSAYVVVGEAGNPKQLSATLKPGKVQVSVPAGQPVWLVAQLVYKDPSELRSPVVSSHVAASPGSGSDVGGRSRRRK